MRQHAVGELAAMASKVGGLVIEGRNQGKDGSSGIGGAVHVADMDFVERRLADAQHQRTLLLQADVGGALDQLEAMPLAMRASVPMLHGITTIASAGYEPLATLAPMSALAC